MASLHYPTDIKEKLHKSRILVDTCIMSGFKQGSDGYLELRKILEEAGASMGTIDLCRSEFLIGSKNKYNYDKNTKFLKELDILIFDSETYKLEKDFDELILLPSFEKCKPSITDLILATIMYKYRKVHSSFYLLTANIKDFPSPNFIKEIVVNVETKDGQLQPLAFIKCEA